MNNNFIEQIVSGGQTGVDRAALDVAIEFGIPHGGWCPHERKAEDGPIPEKYNMRECPAPSIEESVDPDFVYKKRTELNVMESDGTLIIVRDAPIGGTLYTLEMLKKHEKPYLIYTISADVDLTHIANWVIDNNARKLNIAGPRASQTTNIYNLTYSILHALLTHQLLNQVKPILSEKITEVNP